MDKSSVDEVDTPRRQNINMPRPSHEEIPLHLGFSAPISVPETCPERIRARQIFDQLDTDSDGYLTIAAVKDLIRNHQCPNVPEGYCTRVLERHDDLDRIDFEEFFRQSQEHQHHVRHYLATYCQWIIPDPHRRHAPAPAQFRARSFGQDQTDRGTYEDNMKLCPPPFIMIVFSIVQVIAFTVDVLHLKEDFRDIQSVGHTMNGPVAGLLIYDPYQRRQAWRFFTYMFVHIGIWHLVTNLLVQIFLGFFLELVHCWWRVAIVYMAGVVAGSVGMSLVTPNVYLAGASGGVYALITAHLATIIMNFREMKYAVVQLFVFLVYIASDIISVVLNQMKGLEDQTSHMTHFCGALAGLLVGLGVLRNLQVRSWERVLWWVAVIVFVTLMVSGVAVHIFAPKHFRHQF